MKSEKAIQSLSKLAEILDNPVRLEETVENAFRHNRWFTRENIFLSLKNIREEFLDEQKIRSWISSYDFAAAQCQDVGIVMAGNIPLVGFHDFLCVLLSGHRLQIKLSSKDNVLLPFIITRLYKIDEEWKQQISIVEVLKDIDAVIATGSNNSSRYFQFYFGKYPHIIRKNRSSVAVLQGNETKEELEKLGFDIFSYFGLGCRNVSKLFVPVNYSFDMFFHGIERYRHVSEHNKYGNNYDYNRTVLLLNKIPFLTNDFMILKEDQQVFSPVATLHYEFYTDDLDLDIKLLRDESDIQCRAGNRFIAFGETQSPKLSDYADHIDTMKFLSELK